MPGPIEIQWPVFLTLSPPLIPVMKSGSDISSIGHRLSFPLLRSMLGLGKWETGPRYWSHTFGIRNKCSNLRLQCRVEKLKYIKIIIVVCLEYLSDFIIYEKWKPWHWSLMHWGQVSCLEPCTYNSSFWNPEHSYRSWRDCWLQPSLSQ